MFFLMLLFISTTTLCMESDYEMKSLPNEPDSYCLSARLKALHNVVEALSPLRDQIVAITSLPEARKINVLNIVTHYLTSSQEIIGNLNAADPYDREEASVKAEFFLYGFSMARSTIAAMVQHLEKEAREAHDDTMEDEPLSMLLESIHI